MLRAKRCVLPASATLTSADLQWNGGYGADSDPSRGGHCTGAIRSFEPFRGGYRTLDLRHQLPPAVVAAGGGRAISSDRLSIPPVEIGGASHRGAPALPPPKNSMGPDAFGDAGPCFAHCETSGMLQIILRRNLRLAFALAAAGHVVRDFRAPFRSGMLSGDGALTLVAPRVIPLCPAESWLPRLSACLPIGRRLRRLRIACS